MSWPGDAPDETMTRDETLAMLARVGIRADRADEMLTGVEFPVAKRALYRHLAPYGVSRESLTDALGGSP